MGSMVMPPLASMNMDVNGRIFVVTGGTQGLGRAIASHLAQAGASQIILVGRSKSKGDVAVQDLSSPDCRVSFISADLCLVEEVQQIIPRALSMVGAGETISGLVNCAGHTTRGNLFSETPDGFDKHFAVNVRAPFLLTQKLAEHLVARKTGGSIVNVSSVAASGGAPFLTAYSASKAALNTMTKTTAAELAPFHIRVNSLNMGWCLTDHEEEIQSIRDPQWLDAADKSVPLGRILRPDDAAVTILFLLSNSSCLTTGTIVDLHPEFANGMLSLASAEDGR